MPVCVYDSSMWLLLLLMFLPFFLLIPFNNFINYAFSSLTNNIAKGFRIQGLSNDLKSIKCYETARWNGMLLLFILWHWCVHVRWMEFSLSFSLSQKHHHEFIKPCGTFTCTQFILYCSTDLPYPLFVTFTFGSAFRFSHFNINVSSFPVYCVLFVGEWNKKKTKKKKLPKKKHKKKMNE